MKTLSRYTPAETLVLLHGKSAPLKDLLKYTLMDLLLKKVLTTTKHHVKVDYQARPYTATYIQRGGSYQDYKAKRHEKVFTTPFDHSKNAKFLFRHAVQIGYKEAGDKKTYQDYIVSQPELASFVSFSFLQNIFGGFSLNTEGLRMKAELEKELRELEHDLPHWLANDKNKAMDVIRQVKGNVFLVKNLDINLLSEIDKGLVQAESLDKPYHDNPTTSSCSSFSCSTFSCSTWHDFGHHSHSFDSSCGGVSSDSSAGCGSSCGSSCGGGCGGGGD